MELDAGLCDAALSLTANFALSPSLLYRKLLFTSCGVVGGDGDFQAFRDELKIILASLP